MTGHRKLLRAGRRALLFCLVFLFVLSLGAPAEAAGKQSWKVMHVLDVFGDETEDIYLMNSKPFTGTFNTAELSDSPLEAYILVDEHNVRIELWRNGMDRVKFSTASDYIMSIKAEDGSVYHSMGYAFAGYTSLKAGFFDLTQDKEGTIIDLEDGKHILINSSDESALLFLLLCKENSQIKIYLENGDYPENTYLFTVDTGNFGDAYYDALIEPWLASVYERAEQALGAGRYEEASELFEGLGDYKDSAARAEESRKAKLAPPFAAGGMRPGCDTVAAGDYHTVGLRFDGTVIAVGMDFDGQCEVGDWADIVAVAAGDYHTVGLRADGTVVAAGDNEYGQCDVGDWADIVAVAAGDYHTVGIRADGTVVAVGMNNYEACEVGGWTDIVAVAAGWYHTVGLRSDGTAVAVGRNDEGQCEVADWTDIVAVAAGKYHTVGLKADGTVVAVGKNLLDMCDVGDWVLKVPG